VDVEPPPGYTIAWPHGAYDLAKRDKGVEGPRWYVICKSHGTMVEANSGKEGDKLGTVAGRWGWCRSCRAASMTGIWETTGEDREVMDALSVDIGEAGARAFEAGFAWLQNGIEDDIRELAKLPRGTHIGELAASWLHGVLPNRWMMHYDYDFLYRFLAAMFQLRTRAINEPAPCTVSAVDDLALHMILTQGAQRLREEDPERVAKGEEQAWELALNGDDEDVIIALFHEAIEVEPSNNWHFERWFDDYDGDDDDPQYD
jgi:hypothetical protein